jgi:hypothetical protein
MNRSKLSLKVILLAGGVGLATAAALGGSQPAAAQSYDSCPAGEIFDPGYGCTLSGSFYEPYDYGYYGYPYLYGSYGSYYGTRHGGFAHGFSHGMGGGIGHGGGFAHGAAGGFGHGMAGGFGHGGGGGHR